MTNQQGAPEALTDPSPDQLRAIARTARNSSGSASDDCGSLAYVLYGWRAAAIAFRAQQAALVEAQQPAPSAAATLSVSDGQRALHEAILNRLRHAELLEKAHYLMELNSNQARTIGELQDLVEAAPQPSPTPQLPAPTEQQAYDMGAKGAPATDAERLLFEAWMRGHCWALCAAWDGKCYRSDSEQNGNIDPRAMNTRQLWAAWRDRAALSAQQGGA